MEKRKALSAEPNVKIEDIMAAREGNSFQSGNKKYLFFFLLKDLCHMEKTCGTKEIATTRSKLHKILIPKVRSSLREIEFKKCPNNITSFILFYFF